MAYAFLSDEWIEKAHKIRHEYRGRMAPIPHPVRMNLIVTEVPFDEDRLHAHVDTSTGELELDRGHLENPDLSVTVDYITAKAILVDGNPQAAMTAFMNGKIRLEGDMSKLMVFQGAPTDESAIEFALRVREMTE